MGESYTLVGPEFNHSLRVESRPERLTGECGAVVIREIMHRLGLDGLLASRLEDTRRRDLITHTLNELLRTALILLAQGWRNQDDADNLRHDPALRMAVSSRRGSAPLLMTGRDPDGLASQPTLSRLLAMLSTKDNRQVLRECLLVCAARRLKAMRQGHRLRYVTVDIDSLPIEVHGHQPQSERNGHYHARIYHPLIAICAETGDTLDARLRAGAVHTADGADAFILKLLDRTERDLCQVASIRMDAGFPSDNLLTQLEARGTAYVARLRNRCDGFAHNEAILLLNALAFNLVHAARVMISKADGRGWSLQRVRERILRVAGRVLLHGRRVTLIICRAAAYEWSLLWRGLQHLRYADP